jgi:hypothetical protein
MTLHSPQVHGFFSVPVDHLHALGELSQYFRRNGCRSSRYCPSRRPSPKPCGGSIAVSPSVPCSIRNRRPETTREPHGAPERRLMAAAE